MAPVVRSTRVAQPRGCLPTFHHFAPLPGIIAPGVPPSMRFLRGSLGGGRRVARRKGGAPGRGCAGPRGRCGRPPRIRGAAAPGRGLRQRPLQGSSALFGAAANGSVAGGDRCALRRRWKWPPGGLRAKAVAGGDRCALRRCWRSRPGGLRANAVASGDHELRGAGERELLGAGGDREFGWGRRARVLRGAHRPGADYRVGGGIRIFAPTFRAVPGYCGFQL
jgi:hypothetical protein